MLKTNHILLLSTTLIFVLAFGCQRGPALGTVSGTVTFNGEPLRYAYVVFQPIDPPGTYGSAYTDETGEYTLRFSVNRDGAPIGKHQVSIRAAKGDELPDDAPKTVRIRLPEKYNDQTELVREVKAGHNEFDFELEGHVLTTSRDYE